MTTTSTTSAGRPCAAVLGRRGFLRGAAAAGAGMLLAGCASPTPTAPAAPSDLIVLPADRIRAGAPQITSAENARAVPGARVVEQRLDAQVGPLDIGGRTVNTWSFGGALPGPTLRLRAGDHLHARVTNTLPQPTTVHWHGVALRNDMDGVPDVTQAPIPPGGGFDYTFTTPHPGTYMYHPHVGTQLDRGLYGALIVEDPTEPGAYDHELVVLFDDWLDGTGRDPDQVLADLKAHGMGAMRTPGGTPAGAGAAGAGAMAHSDLLGGDAGDVDYPFYLANGRTPADPATLTARPGQRIRLRIINIGGDTAFRVAVPGTPMTITHTDGYPVTPTPAAAVVLGMGERLDALVTMPEQTTPLLGIAEGKHGFAHLPLSTGTGPMPDPTPAATAIAAGPAILVNTLTPTPAVALAPRPPDVTHQLTLAGPGPGYRWTIDGQPYDPTRGLPVHPGQRVRLQMTNTTTMYHPMHLHGHTFQVTPPGRGTGPRKDTAIVLPGQSLRVEFDADNPGQWLTHCHNIYHGESAMMTTVSYLP